MIPARILLPESTLISGRKDHGRKTDEPRAGGSAAARRGCTDRGIMIEITDFSCPELDLYVRTGENNLRTFNEPAPGLFIAESPKVIRRALNAGYEPVSFLVTPESLGSEAEEILRQIGVSLAGGPPVYLASEEERLNSANKIGKANLGCRLRSSRQHGRLRV